jgi:hypothetical protein
MGKMHTEVLYSSLQKTLGEDVQTNYYYPQGCQKLIQVRNVSFI